MAYRLGIDIGGTFTDANLMDEETGEVFTAKVSSTPKDPAAGFSEAAQRILREHGVAPGDVSYVMHATTVATNAIIEGKVARTGFITTDGFRDMLEIARQIRPSLYDLRFEKPRPLVPRHLCFGIPERLGAQGVVLAPLDEDAVRRTGEELRREGVEAVAVCLLHAYANADHERRVGEILRDCDPQAVVSLSSEVAPEFREYARASTTVINACISPVVARYLQRIEDHLRGEGVDAQLLVMQSGGGVFSFAAAREKPVFMVESGPAAGVISATHLGTTLGYDDLISFDMGGTTAKVGLIQDGTPRITKDYEVGATAKSSGGTTRGEGYPIRTPVIDLVEIGAGGGSIAWVDSGGVLRVGPHSAGADPGPVCYGRGGAEPTITDANLVLGRLNPRFFLGGEIGLDEEAARRAIQEHCATPLDLDVTEAAHGIVEIANAAMVNALRLVSIQRGNDPREFVLVAFGGAGPVHACRLAAEMEIPTTVIPTSPGTTSATGLLVTDLKQDYSITRIQRLDQLDHGAVEEAYLKLETQGRETLEQEGMAPAAMTFLRQVDIRYVGQSYELTLSLPDHRLDPEDIAAVLEEFHSEHDRAYGFSAAEEAVEFVAHRLTATGEIGKPSVREWDRGTADPAAAQKESRLVYFAESDGFVHCPIYDRFELGVDCVVRGPAVVEEIDSTTVVHPDFQFEVDRFGNLVVSPVFPK